MTLQSKYTNKDVKNPTQGENSFVTLPFPALRLNWYNGVAQMKASKDVRYFGGWFAGSDKVSEDLVAMGVDTLPAQFAEEKEFISRGNETFNAYEARYLYIAPVCTKDDWYSEFDEKKGGMSKRHRVDMLALLGTHVKGKTIEPWGMAVLSSKGFAATAFVQAMRGFATVTADVRRNLAPDVPTMFFYAPVGTFGDKLVTAPAGESTYTPAQLMSVDWTDKSIEALYVSDGDWQDSLVASQGEASEWLKDTRGSREKTATGTEDNGVVDGSQARRGIDDDAPF